MIEIDALRDYCHQLLDCGAITDHCPNGLQVEGERPVERLICGVTASLALIDSAVSHGADALLVHHGYFWKGESPCLVGMKGGRIRALMRSGMSLYAYHLPLDVHPELGNNRQLARVLGILDPAPAAGSNGLLWSGRLPEPVPGKEFEALTEHALGREALHVVTHERPIESLAWCTGGGQGYIEQAAELGVDGFVSGEISEQTPHQARELGVDYFAVGHHATERYGVQALGAHLADRFGLESRFLDLDNPA